MLPRSYWAGSTGLYFFTLKGLDSCSEHTLLQHLKAGKWGLDYVSRVAAVVIMRHSPDKVLGRLCPCFQFLSSGKVHCSRLDFLL